MSGREHALSTARTVGQLTDQLERMHRAGLGHCCAALGIYRDLLLVQLGRTPEQLDEATPAQAAAAFPHFGTGD